MIATVNGTQIYYDVEGSGLVPDGHRMRERPALFVLHGGPGLDHTYFKPWLTPLTEVFQLVYVDHRGNGRSAAVDRATCRLPRMAADLEGLRTHLGLPPIAVLGHSYGGFLALTYATGYPDSVSMVFAVGTAASHRFYARAADVLEQRASPEQKELAPKLRQNQVRTEEALRHWWLTMLPLYFHRYDPAIGLQQVERMILNAETCAEVLADDLPNYDIENSLASVSAPTLVMVGRNDWVTPVSESELIVAGIPGSQLKVFEKSGHYPFIEENRDFVRVVVDFARRFRTSTQMP